ncbi:MAG: D-alanyl-D-alanine carboxypeptidase [Oscillospiraceae bacterium]|nr:D-alanyl-D-alanine carboxypeptidase [Oscillospiraceae bacterium]
MMYEPKHVQTSRQRRSRETEPQENGQSRSTETEWRESRRSRTQTRQSPPPQRSPEPRQRPYSPDQYSYPLTKEEQEARRSGSAEARRLRSRAKRKKNISRVIPLLLAAVLLVTGACAGTVFLLRTLFDRHPTQEPPDVPDGILDSQEPPEDLPDTPRAEPVAADKTVFRPTPEIVRIAEGDETYSSGYMILVDLDTETIIAEKNAWATIHPASMTKIMTLLVAAEHLQDLTGSAVVSQETINYCIEHDCSVAGFAPGEEAPVMDLLYGTILPSGADAALTLAEYVAGSQTEFVRMMNEKAEELGISRTAHFANCIGLYDESNVCTPYDMALILNAAMKNGLCRMVLGERIYNIQASTLHPEGLNLSNWFIRRIEDHMPAGVTVKGAKTGFIKEAGNCAASFAEDASGHTCICVTAMAGSVWQCIFDHVALYETYGFAA